SAGDARRRGRGRALSGVADRALDRSADRPAAARAHRVRLIACERSLARTCPPGCDEEFTKLAHSVDGDTPPFHNRPPEPVVSAPAERLVATTFSHEPPGLWTNGSPRNGGNPRSSGTCPYWPGFGSELVSTTSNIEPVILPSVCRSSFDH